MATKRKLNVSGYRGVWGDTLTDKIVGDYTRGFARFTKEVTNKENPTILVGRDGRASGPAIAEVIKRELKNVGVTVVYGDVMPTPTVLFSVRKHAYDGAIIITASHNPIEYNGLKFVNHKALFTIESEVEKIEKYYEDESERGNVISGGIAQPDEPNTPNFAKEHADHIVANVNAEAIRARKFKVVADMINASACVMDPYLFEQLGVEVTPLNNIPNGNFGHRPEPLRENLESVMQVARDIKADIGFVHDPDADRLVLIDENGEVISEEYSLAFGIENILSKNPGKPVVINLSTSQMGADIAKSHGSECFRSKIGEGYVVDKIIEKNAIIGGEGNGGVIYPKINTVRDSFTTLSLVLEFLAERKLTVTECIATFPKYFIKKDKWPVGRDLNEIYTTLKTHFSDAKFDEQDGLRLDLSDGSWLHLRPSNTEPIIRLFGEAKSMERIEALFEEAKLTLGLK